MSAHPLDSGKLTGALRMELGEAIARLDVLDDEDLVDVVMCSSEVVEGWLTSWTRGMAVVPLPEPADRAEQLAAEAKVEEQS